MYNNKYVEELTKSPLQNLKEYQEENSFWFSVLSILSIFGSVVAYLFLGLDSQGVAIAVGIELVLIAIWGIALSIHSERKLEKYRRQLRHNI